MSDKTPLVVLCQGVWPIFGFARDELEAAADNFEGGVLGYWRFWPSTLEKRGYETLILKQPALGGQEACVAEAVAQVKPHVDEGRRLILVGHSRGGWVVRGLAREFPDAVDVLVTIATPHTGQWLVDFNLAMEAEDPDSLKAKIEGTAQEAYEEGKRGIKALIKRVGRRILPDEVRAALRSMLGRAREVQARLDDEIGGAIQHFQAQAGDWEEVYASYNTAAAVQANKDHPNLDGVVYINVLGELDKDGFVPPELAYSAAILEMISSDAILPPFGPFAELARTFQGKHESGYGKPVQAHNGQVIRERKHDAATHADCCVIPWGHYEGWEHDNPSTVLSWKLDHCRQVGLFPSKLLDGYIHDLVNHWEKRRQEMDAASA